MTGGSAEVADDGILSSLRYLFADFLAETDSTPPSVPDGLPDGVVPIVSEGIHRLMEYQGVSYAGLYVERVRRFVGKPGFDAAMLCEIARLMAIRMSYEDPIRIAQIKLVELETGSGDARSSNDDVRRFRFDELIGALPAAVAAPVLGVLEKLGWTHRTVSIRFSTATSWGIRRLKFEAFLRRWRLFSIRYGEERVWVERWLHMISRSLVKQPKAAFEIVQTATMIQGYGRSYRQGLVDWHAIIDGLVKPAFDGDLPLDDIAGAVAEARAAATLDPRQVALKRAIAQIRARALGSDTEAAAE